MVLLLPAAVPSVLPIPRRRHPHHEPRLLRLVNPNPRRFPPPYPRLRRPLFSVSLLPTGLVRGASDGGGGPSRNSSAHSSPTPSRETLDPRRLNAPPPLLHLAAPVVLFFVGLAQACAVGPATAAPIKPSTVTASPTASQIVESADLVTGNREEDEESRIAFERWKSKTYPLTVPLRIVALRSSLPPSWIKDFMKAQGKRLKLIPDFRGSIDSIFSELSLASKKGDVEPRSAMAADIVSIGDSWLNRVISGGLIEPIKGVEEQDWFNGLSNKWKVYLRRNNEGEVDPGGDIWGAPYRWGSMVIAYKKNKFRKHNLTPIKDWEDLWRPELAGKIVMVDSPREVIGAVLKFMGASYNTRDIDLQVAGGRSATMQNLMILQRQVLSFDSIHYLKAFATGDVWIAVGWSSDVLPAAKRMSDVAVIVPKSGSSLWADIWAIPAATRFNTHQIGGRTRGPSPVIHQWIEFCLQTARGLPFQQETVPGASPSALENPPVGVPRENNKRKPNLETNLISGVPPPEILKNCEFLEPLSEKALLDYQWLIANMQKPGGGWIKSSQDCISSLIQKVGTNYSLVSSLVQRKGSNDSSR